MRIWSTNYQPDPVRKILTSSVPLRLRMMVQKMAEKRKSRARERKTVGSGISPVER